MAISKNITASNGVPLSYHRVVSVNCIKGVQNIIEVASYISAAEREKEVAAYDSVDPSHDVYIDTTYINVPYDPNMTLTDAYEVVKGIDMFNGSSDVFETGNDPVAVAMSEAKEGNYTSELVDTPPADVEGFIAVPRIENLGYSVVWDLVEDPEYVS